MGALVSVCDVNAADVHDQNLFVNNRGLQGNIEERLRNDIVVLLSNSFDNNVGFPEMELLYNQMCPEYNNQEQSNKLISLYTNVAIPVKTNNVKDYMKYWYKVMREVVPYEGANVEIMSPTYIGYIESDPYLHRKAVDLFTQWMRKSRHDYNVLWHPSLEYLARFENRCELVTLLIDSSRYLRDDYVADGSCDILLGIYYNVEYLDNRGRYADDMCKQLCEQSTMGLISLKDRLPGYIQGQGITFGIRNQDIIGNEFLHLIYEAQGNDRIYRLQIGDVQHNQIDMELDFNNRGNNGIVTLDEFLNIINNNIFAIMYRIPYDALAFMLSGRGDYSDNIRNMTCDIVGISDENVYLGDYNDVKRYLVAVNGLLLPDGAINRLADGFSRMYKGNVIVRPYEYAANWFRGAMNSLEGVNDNRMGKNMIQGVVDQLKNSHSDNDQTFLYKYLSDYNNDNEQVFLSFLRNHSPFMLSFIFKAITDDELSSLLNGQARRVGDETVINYLLRQNEGIGYRCNDNNCIIVFGLNWHNVAKAYCEDARNINVFRDV